MNKGNIKILNRKKKKKRIAGFVFIFAAVIAGSIALYFFARHSIVAREIIFTGNRYLKNEELQSLIGIKVNDKMYSIADNAIYKNLKSSPWIKDAVIRREFIGFSSGRILINVKEAVPIAILKMSERIYLVDKDGSVLEPLKEGTVFFLPVIKEIDPMKSKEAFIEAVRFIMVLHERKLFSPGDNIVITGQRPEDISLELEGVTIKIGSGDLDKKLDRLGLVTEELEKRNMQVEYIDLRFTDKIIVKPLIAAQEETKPAAIKKTPDKVQGTTKKDAKKKKRQ